MAGFDFSNHSRNAALHAKGMALPRATSTGTTIVGCLFDGGVIIAADTRATSGEIVADKVIISNPIPLGLPLTRPELREASLHLPQHLVRRRRHRR
jgi:20S proteasome subunit beta 2